MKMIKIVVVTLFGLLSNLTLASPCVPSLVPVSYLLTADGQGNFELHEIHSKLGTNSLALSFRIQGADLSAGSMSVYVDRGQGEVYLRALDTQSSRLHFVHGPFGKLGIHQGYLDALAMNAFSATEVVYLSSRGNKYRSELRRVSIFDPSNSSVLGSLSQGSGHSVDKIAYVERIAADQILMLCQGSLLRVQFFDDSSPLVLLETFPLAKPLTPASLFTAPSGLLDYRYFVANDKGVWISGGQVTYGKTIPGGEFFHLYLDFQSKTVRAHGRTQDRVLPLAFSSSTQDLMAQVGDSVIYIDANTGASHPFFPGIFDLSPLITTDPNFASASRESRFYFQPLAQTPSWFSPVSLAVRPLPAASAAAVPAPAPETWLLYYWRTFAGQPGLKLPDGVKADALPTTLSRGWFVDFMTHTDLRYEIVNVSEETWTTVGLKRSTRDSLKIADGGSREDLINVSTLWPLLPQRVRDPK
jgi:hypothetical protein